MRPELRLQNLDFFNICRHHPTLKFKPHATDDERYVSGVDGVPLNKVYDNKKNITQSYIWVIDYLIIFAKIC